MECAHTIGLPIDRAFVEDHHILRQSSCLVREHILNLAELFIESGSASLCWDVLWCIKHLSIPVDIVTVAQSYYFNTKEKKKEKMVLVRAGQANILFWFPSYRSMTEEGLHVERVSSLGLPSHGLFHTSQSITTHTIMQGFLTRTLI